MVGVPALGAGGSCAIVAHHQADLVAGQAGAIIRTGPDEAAIKSAEAMARMERRIGR